MANTGFIDSSELDFTSYKQSLKTFLSQQSQFQDYDFEGSNLVVLLDLLAYNTYHNAIYLNMVGSEMWMDTAQQRESVVSHAKELNYIPRSRASARASINILANPTDNPSTITLPKFYSVTGSGGDGSIYTFSTNEPVVLSRSSNYYAANVIFYEGAIKTEAFLASSDPLKNVFKINSNRVDISSIEVQVRTSSTDLISETWNRTDTLFDIDGDSKVFFVQPAEDFTYAVTFGNGVTGKTLAAGNIVFVTYRETSGADANGVDSFNTQSSADGYSPNTFILSYSSGSYGGAQAEDVDSIRYNAVRGFSTQGRAVTVNDFVALIKSNFSTIQTVTAYGGEEANPKKFGKVIIAAKPYDSESLPESLKEEMRLFLKERSVVSIDPVIVDPDYMYVQIASRVKYNVNNTVLTSGEIRQKVLDAIINFNVSSLSDFGSDLRFSKLSSTIDNVDSSILSNDTQVKMIKRIVPTAGVSFNASWSFENQLYSESVRYVLPVGHEPIVSSTGFVYDGYNAFIQDDGVGNLFIYTVSTDGLITKLNNSVGTVDYTDGTVTITNLIVDSYEGDYIKIFAKPENADIETVTNKILLIDQEDVSILTTGFRF